MTAIPQYHGCFTLLYADPEVLEQQRYLQPLYGLTADDDPPAAQHQRESSPDASISSASSLTSTDGTHDNVLHMQRISIPGEPAVCRHKNLRISSGFTPASAGVGEEGEGDEEESDGRVRTQRRGNNSETATTFPNTNTTIKMRPPRRIRHVDLSLYTDLCAGVVGPQPVFGGVALKREERSSSSPVDAVTTTRSKTADTASASSPTRPYLFNSTGSPLLSSVVEPDALQRLQEARKPYPAPQPRSGHVLLPCPSRGTLILYGGLGDDPFNDVWEYSTATGRWTKLHCVPAPDSTEVMNEEEGGLASRDAYAADDGHPPHRVAASDMTTPSSHSQQPQHASSQVEPEDDSDVGPAPNGTLAARLRARNRNAAVNISSDEDDDSTSSDSDTSIDAEEDEETDEEAANTSPLQATRRNENMPPPAYGQAASLYVDEYGDTCMAVLGGITVGDVCVHGFFSLNLVTLTWRRLETTMRMKDVWGATAQTLYVPRQYTRSSSSFSANKNNTWSTATGKKKAEEEQVVVLFGGMTAMGEVIAPTTHILHLDHPLTADEIAANAEMFLASMDYDKTEGARVLRRVLREEDVAAQVENGAPTDDNQTLSVDERCAQWRVAHADQLVRWRQRALRSLEGKYWTEAIPATSALHGRRRPTSAAFRRNFMYIFGGRDDLYFYNDLWCLNVVTRTWVQVRDGIPTHLLRQFLEHPYNPRFGMLLNERGAQLRRRTVAAVEAKLSQNSASSTVNNMVRNRDIHHALYSSSVNSTARARTGACMVVDVRRECLYLYGGFSYTGQQHLTFFDLHAYHIKENVWRRVAISQGRPWEVTLDAGQDAVNLVDPCEEARPYPRHACAQEKPQSDAENAVTSSASLPLTLMGYAIRHLHPPATQGSNTSISSVYPPDQPPAPPIVRRGQRMSSYNSIDNHSGDRGDISVSPADYFHLPTFVPEARTMAAMAEDPLHPGTRFFLHGGRSGEEACGDFFELRTGVSRTVDIEYAKTQRDMRIEAQSAAASGNNSPRSSPPNRHSTTNNDNSTIAPTFNNNPTSPPSSTLGGPMFVPVVSTAAAAATSAPGAQVDANHLQLRHRRQLQRQLLSAALEEQEEFEDAPAAHATTMAEIAPLPRQSLRDAATRWIRDGLAAADPKSLMFVELRNGHAVVNLRTHIHYSSRLSLLASSEQRTEDSTGNRTASFVGGQITSSPPAVSSRRGGGGYGSVRRSNSGLDPSPVHPASSTYPFPAISLAAQQQQMDSLDGHLKRSALSLEILIYDVLLSKPMCNNPSNSSDGLIMTSPCTHSAILSISPETHASFPSCPPAGNNSPVTSPSNSLPLPSSPHVYVVSRAQYSTPRTPQPLGATAGTNQPQQQQRTAFPLQQDVSGARTAQERRTPSPALTRRLSSFCSNSTAGTGAQQPPSNNEYDYHIMLRSLFHHEPYYKTLGASEKKR